MTKGEQIINRVVELIMRPEILMSDRINVMNLINPYFLRPNDLDIMTICRLEVILKEDLLIIPTKQQWRKIKLEKLNEISENE
jgi:hypothetical protein